MGAGLPSWKPSKKPRINWKNRLKQERNIVIDEAIRTLRNEMRSRPDQWRRGYNSAVTVLENMKS